MYVVTLVTQKGGSGKSTLTVGLAVAAMEDANRVAVIEADSQGTVSSWRRRRTNPYPRVDRDAAEQWEPDEARVSPPFLSCRSR